MLRCWLLWVVYVCLLYLFYWFGVSVCVVWGGLDFFGFAFWFVLLLCGFRIWFVFGCCVLGLFGLSLMLCVTVLIGGLFCCLFCIGCGYCARLINLLIYRYLQLLVF